MLRILLSLALATIPLSAACGGDDDDDASDDADAAPGEPDAAPTEPDAAPTEPDAAALDTCGPGPYATFSASLTSFLDPTTAIEGAVVTIDLCEGKEFVSDAAGLVTFQLTTDVEFNGTIRAEGYLPARTTVEVLQGDLATDGPLLPDSLIPLFPNWSDDSPTAVVATFINPDALPKDAPKECLTAAGITVSVVDHPEAVVIYYSAGPPPMPDPKLTETTASGLAELSGIEATAPGESLTVQFDKPGCDLGSLVSYPHLDRITLSNGVMTNVGIFIPPTPFPEGTPGD